MPASSATARSASSPRDCLRRVQAERDTGERRAEAVVQVAAQPAALLLARGHEREPGLLQCGGHPRGVGGDAGLAGEVGEQPPVGGAEVLARARGADTTR